MDIVWLEDFLALAELGNFSRAAEARHITQPAFSRRIRSLEDRLGAPLFERGGGGTTLTPAGRVLHPTAEDIVRRMRQTARDIRRLSRDEGSTLLFAATHALSFTFLPNWMRELERDSPLGPLSLASDSLRGCEALMMQGDAQFLLCHQHHNDRGRFAAPRFLTKIVGADRLEPYCAPDDDGAPLWRLEEDMEPTPYLAYSSESGLRRILDTTVMRHRRVTPLKAVVTSHLAATLSSLAREQRGIAWLPRTLVNEDIAAGRLVSCGDESWSVPLDVVVIRPASPMDRSAEALWSKIGPTA